jgi:hypothetical protein
VVVVVAISAPAAEVTRGLQTRIHWGTEAQRHRGTGTGGQRTFLLRRQHRAVRWRRTPQHALPTTELSHSTHNSGRAKKQSPQDDCLEFDGAKCPPLLLALKARCAALSPGPDKNLSLVTRTSSMVRIFPHLRRAFDWRRVAFFRATQS